MRMTTRVAALPALACALLVTAGFTPADPARAPSTWSPSLLGGEAAGVRLTGGEVRLDLAAARLMPADADGAPVPTGLLTLDEHALAAPTDRVAAAVAGDLPTGSTAAVDVRGQRPDGGWTEWVPAAGGVAALPDRVSEVQTRLVLTGGPGAEPAVRDVTLTALPAAARAEFSAATMPLGYRVFATREGLVGGTTANGHVIADRDHFVALPSRRALAPRGTGDYSVRVCASTGRCAFAPVWDVGPWNTRDDYWNPPAQRQEWKDLPQGVPQAQAARGDGYNGGLDQYGRRVANPAGIDLGDGLFWDALGLRDNSWVTVDYLWTGTTPLAAVVADRPVDVVSSPAAGAAVVGTAAARASLPVECALTQGDRTWLRVGLDQYVAAEAVPSAQAAPCDVPAPPPVASGPEGGGGAAEPVEPDPSETPDPSTTPDPSATPDPSESPDPSATPDPSESPDPSATPDPSASPDPSESPAPPAGPDGTVPGCTPGAPAAPGDPVIPPDAVPALAPPVADGTGGAVPALPPSGPVVMGPGGVTAGPVSVGPGGVGVGPVAVPAPVPPS